MLTSKPPARPASRSTIAARPIRLGLGCVLAGGLCVTLFASPIGGCSSSSPVDMWISKDPDAGSGFDAPARETGSDAPDDAAGADADNTSGTAGTTGASGTTGGGGGAGGAGGSAGTTGGSGGNAGAGGAAGA